MWSKGFSWIKVCQWKKRSNFSPCMWDMNVALGNAADFKGWICMEEKLHSYLHHWESMMLFAICILERASLCMYALAHFLFVVQMQYLWQKVVSSIYSNKTNSHEKEKECTMLPELAWRWCTDGSVLKVSWAVELAALKGMLCTLEETWCCTLTGSLHSVESILLFHTNTCKVEIVL